MQTTLLWYQHSCFSHTNILTYCAFQAKSSSGNYQWLSWFPPCSQYVEVEGTFDSRFDWGPPSVQRGLKIRSKIWFGPCVPVVSSRLQSVWFTRGRSRRDHPARTGFGFGRESLLPPLPTSPNSNHERLSVFHADLFCIHPSLLSEVFWGSAGWWFKMSWESSVCRRQGNDRVLFQVQDVGLLLERSADYRRPVSVCVCV